MEAVRQRYILNPKIPAAEIQPFSDRRHMGNSGLCVLPRFRHSRVGRQVLNASKRISSSHSGLLETI